MKPNNKKTIVNYKKIKRDLMLRDNETNDRRFVSKVVPNKKKLVNKEFCKKFKYGKD
jgi:hypothetical protein